jgi:hypothetical protein
MFSSLLYGNNASTKEKELSMKLHETFVMLGCYITLTPYVMLFNFPFLVVLLYYGIK